MSDKRKILLVDDEQDILEILTYNLSKAGYEVFTAKNGALGLKKALDEVPALIILDYMMPVLDGLETCILMREEPLLRDTKIAMLSARSESSLVREAFKNGADDYIAKPISPSLFVDKIHHLLAV